MDVELCVHFIFASTTTTDRIIMPTSTLQTGFRYAIQTSRCLQPLEGFEHLNQLILHHRVENQLSKKMRSKNTRGKEATSNRKSKQTQGSFLMPPLSTSLQAPSCWMIDEATSCESSPPVTTTTSQSLAPLTHRCLVGKNLQQEPAR